MSETRRRYAEEALGLLLVVAALLTALALFSHNPQDPTPFFVSSSGGNLRPTNWAGTVGAVWSQMLLTAFGLTSWLIPAGLAAWGARRFAGRRAASPGTKAVGLLLAAASLPALLSIAIGSVTLRGEPLPAGGLLGAAVASIAQAKLNTAGSVILLASLLVLAVPLSTQVSLSEVLFLARVRAKAFFARMSLGISRRREQKMKERLRRTVVKKHIERARDAGIRPAPLAPSPTLQVRQVEADRAPFLRKVELPPAGSADGAAPRPERPREKPAEKKRDTRQPPLLVDVGGYLFPQTSLLERYAPQGSFDRKQLPEIARRITEKCAEFGVEGEVVEFHPGPVVTTYEFRPAAGVKVTQVMGMAEDLALALSAESIRIERIPGRSSVGIEVPNPDGGDIIALRDVIESERFAAERSLLALALGKDIHGEPVVANLQSMPHLLIAGTTGSGKSVGINAIITSILFKATPSQVKFILIDPKMVELEIYRDTPHLLTPIVTDPRRAANALRNMVGEMERRYRVLADFGNVRNLDQYNRAIQDKHTVAEVKARLGDAFEEPSPLPYIVVVIDELADLMMTAPKVVEESIARIAQKARAVGIHLVVATQRPSTDVVTGVIKANLPARVAFKVATRVDSRVILDGNGAEKLLGRGDLLYLGPGSSRLVRIHGAYISVQETATLVKFLKKQARPEYVEGVTDAPAEEAHGAEEGSAAAESDNDPLYDQAARLVVKERMASISFLQRRMGVGFSRAGKLIDMMDRDGLLGPARGSKPREVLVPPDYFDAVDQQAR